MLFSVGYNPDNDRFLDVLEDCKENIAEVYFAYGGIPNGRGTVNLGVSLSENEPSAKTEEDLKAISSLGIKLNLLLNANCYGKDAQAREFYIKIGDTVEHLLNEYGLYGVTTTSPLIAKFLKQNFEGLEVRASVNMEIGTQEGMDYLAEYFDAFYLKREYNRNEQMLKAARRWCDENGKKLYGLANSGCLNFCSSHIFHDNLVAHESEIATADNAYQYEGQCWEYLKNDAKKADWLRLTNFIRPEDVSLYEGVFDGMKLATRVSRNAAGIIRAYTKGSFNGSLHQLLEPNHSGLFYPTVIDNKSICADFGERVMKCEKNCTACGYCSTVQRNATIILE